MSQIQVVTHPHIFSQRDVGSRVFSYGKTFQQILEEVEWHVDLEEYTRIYVDGKSVPQEFWRRARPKIGCKVLIVLVPSGGRGGGKQIVAAIAAIVVAIAAPYAMGAIAPELTAAVLGGGATLAESATYAAGIATISLVGNLAINALFKPPPVNNSPAQFTPSSSPSYSITGQSNVKTPGQACLKVYGQFRVFPRIIGDPYLTTEGPNTYMHMLLDWGYAPLDVGDIRIGDTPLTNFSDYALVHHENLTSETELQIYTTDVATEGLSFTLQYQVPVTARTRKDARVATLDFFFPQGLICWHKDFSVPISNQVWCTLEWRNVTTNGPWRAFTDGVITSIQTPKGAGIDGAGGFTFTVRPTTLAAEGTLETSYGFPTGTSSFTVTSSIIPKIGDRFIIQGIVRTVTGAVGNVISFSPAMSTYWETQQAQVYYVLDENLFKTWVAVPASDVALNVLPTGSRLVVENNELKAFTTSVRVEFPSASEYEFRVTRISQIGIPPHLDPRSAGRDAFDPDSVIDDMAWIGIKSFAVGRAPVYPRVPHTVTEIRIRSSDQFSGVISTINGICTSKLQVRDPNTGLWSLQPSASPAWIYHDILTGAWNPRAVPISWDTIDYPALHAFDAHCVANGYRCDTVIDYPVRVRDLVDSVLSNARAVTTRKDGKYSVLWEDPNEIVTQVFTPLNSWSMSASRVFADMPQGLKVKFIDPTSNWEERTFLAYDDGYYDPENPPVPVPAGLKPALKTEEYPTFGVCFPSLAWKLGRQALAEYKLRPVEYTLMVDIEHMVCQVGSKVGVQSDTIGSGGRACRVGAVVSSNLLQVDEPFGAIDPAGVYGLVIRYASGQVSNVISCFPEAQSDDIWRTAVPHNSQIGDVCIWGFADRVVNYFIVKAIQPSSDFTAKLTLMDVAAGVAGAAEGPIPPYFPPTGGRPNSAFGLTPKNLVATLIERIDLDRVRKYDVRLHWEDSPLVFEWRVYRVNVRTQARIPLGNPTAPEILALQGFDRRYIAAAGEDLVFDVTGVSRLGTESPAARVSVRVVPDTTSPLSPRTLSAQVNEQQVTLVWSVTEEDDVTFYQIRYHSSLSAWDWNTAEIIAASIPWQVISETFPARIGTYLIKCLDSSGNYSDSPTSAQVIDIPAGLGNTVLGVDVGAGRNWAGTTFDCTVISNQLKADSVDKFWLNGGLKFWGDGSAVFWRPAVYKDMQWTFSVQPPADGIGTNMVVAATITGSFHIEYSRDGSKWYTFPGNVLADSGIYQFRISVAGGAVQGVISNCSVNFDVPDLDELIPAINIDSAGTRLPITKPFRAITAVIPGLDKTTAHNAISIGILDYSATLGPLVKGIDAAGAYVGGRATFMVRGY